MHLPAHQREAIAAHTALPREIDAGITAWDDVAANANLAVTDDPIDSETEDTAGPLIATSTLNLQIGTGTLVLTFDETVDFSTFDSSAITITDSAGANGVALSAAPTEAADGTTMTIALTSTQREAIAAHTALPREIDATTSAWDDLAGTPNANAAVTDDPIDSETEDTEGPILQTSTLNLDGDSPTFVLTFDESVNGATYEEAQVTITDSAGNNGITLTNSVNEASGTTMTTNIELSEKQLLAAMSTPRQIDATTLAWDDLAGTPNANLAVTDDPIDTENEDTTAPLISTSTLNLNTDPATLILTFDESVDESAFDPTTITITDSAGAGGITLTASSPNESADGTTMTIDLSSGERTSAIALFPTTPRELDITTSAWADVAGNGNAAVTDDPIDTEVEGNAPSFTADRTALGTIELTFNENVDAAAADELTAWDVSTGTVTAVTDPEDSTSMTITYTGDAATDSTPTVTYNATNGTVEDTDMNEVNDGENAVATDSVAPTMTAATTGSSVIVTFSENVDALSTGTGAGWTVTGTDAGARTITGNTDPDDSSNTITLTLSSEFASEDPDATVTYTSGAGDLTDVAGNELVSGASPNITDGIIPTMQSATTTSTTTVDVTFSENIDDGTVLDAGDFTVGGVATTIADASGAVVTLTVGTAFATDATPQIVLTAANGGVADTTGNALASDLTGVTATDGLAPTFSAQTLSLTTTTLTFSEGIDAGTFANSTWAVAGTNTNVSIDLDGDAGAGQTTAVLTHDAIADGGVTPTVGYTQGDLADQSSNLIATGAASAVTDGIAPVFSSAEVVVENRVDVTFDEAMADPGATPGDFVIGGTLTNAPVTVTSITVSGDDLQLGLDKDIDASDTVSVAFTNSGTRPTDTATVPNDLADFAAQSVTINLAPTLVSAETGPAIDEITYTFNNVIDISTVAAADFGNLNGTTPDGITTAVDSTSIIVSYDGNFAVDFTNSTFERFSNLASIDNTSGASLVQGTGITSVAITDGLEPTLSAVDTVSNNANGATTSLAIAGETITVNITADENIDASQSTITILGRSVTENQVSPTQISGTTTVQAGDTNTGVTLTANVADTAGNTLAITQSDITGNQITVDTTDPAVSTLTIATNGGSVDNDYFASNTEVVTIVLNVDETVIDLATQIGASPSLVQSNDIDHASLPATRTLVANSGTQHTVTYTVDDGTVISDGDITFSITVEDTAGNTATFDQDDTTDFSTATVSNALPTVTSATLNGGNTIIVNFNLEMDSSTIAAGDFLNLVLDPNGSSPDATRTVSGASNSNSHSVILTFSGTAVSAGVDAEVDIDGISSVFGTAFAGPITQSVSSSSTTATVSSSDPVVAITDDTFVTTISAGSTEPQLDLSGLTGGTFPASDISITTSSSSVTFPAGVTASSLPTDDVISVAVSTKTATGISGNIGTIIEFGDPGFDITFDLPVRISLPNKAGGNAFYIGSNGVTVPITLDCGQDNFAHVRDNILTGINNGDECVVDDNGDLIIYTEHFTGFGAGGGSGSTGSAGGGSSGDHSSPSLTAGFDPNEYPLEYDGVKYQFSEFESIPNTVIKTGNELEATLTVYDNSGPSAIQHVDFYVNHFGERILNDMTETYVTYDTQFGLEITDPYDLISTANITPSTSGNKAVFDFEVVFKDEVPTSDVVIRLWDVKRNPMYLHLPDVLTVELSAGGIISSESSTSESSTSESSTSESSTSESSTSESSTSESSTSESSTSESSTSESSMSNVWTDRQLSVLKKWSGYDTELASDADVLSEFGIKGETIPAYVSDVTKWILDDQITPEEFVTLLQYLKTKGVLSDRYVYDSSSTDTSTDTEKLVAESQVSDEKIKFEFNDDGLSTKANFDDLEDKLRILRALANNEIIQNELARSNAEFDALDDPVSLIDQRDSDWTRNSKIITPFMATLMNNEPALVGKAIIEHDAESVVPLTSIMITNAHGVNVIITERTQDYDQSDEQWWSKTKADGAYIMSGSGSEEHGGLYTAEISSTITDSDGNFVGIIKAVVNFEKALISN